jgi:hypothetical protein
MSVALQELFVVIRLDHERVHLAQTLHDHFRGITEISNESESARAGVEREADRIDRVMGHGEGLDGDIANLELGARAENSPVSMLI